MLAQFFSNEVSTRSNQEQYFNISNKQKIIFDLKNKEKNVINKATENIKRNLFELTK